MRRGSCGFFVTGGLRKASSVVTVLPSTEPCTMMLPLPVGTSVDSVIEPPRLRMPVPPELGPSTVMSGQL